MNTLIKDKTDKNGICFFKKAIFSNTNEYAIIEYRMYSGFLCSKGEMLMGKNKRRMVKKIKTLVTSIELKLQPPTWTKVDKFVTLFSRFTLSRETQFKINPTHNTDNKGYKTCHGFYQSAFPALKRTQQGGHHRDRRRLLSTKPV